MPLPGIVMPFILKPHRDAILVERPEILDQAILVLPAPLAGEKRDDRGAALEKFAGIALAEAKKQGATYCDIRINRYRNQFTGYRLSPERGGSKTDEVPYVYDGSSFGFGVRVIAKGQWGFAASPNVTAAEIARITREAVTVAKANSIPKLPYRPWSPMQVEKTRHHAKRNSGECAGARDEI